MFGILSGSSAKKIRLARRTLGANEPIVRWTLNWPNSKIEGQGKVDSWEEMSSTGERTSAGVKSLPSARWPGLRRNVEGPVLTLFCIVVDPIVNSTC